MLLSLSLFLRGCISERMNSNGSVGLASVSGGNHWGPVELRRMAMSM
jgi:hypothetical protein